MQIVIDIPEDVYKRTVFYREFKDLNDCVTTIKALENGTPLPEHHGDLIDVNALKTNIHYVPIAPIFQSDYVTYRNVIFADILDMLPTIIEADKESDADE